VNTSTLEAARIVVADEHPVIRMAIKRLIDGDPALAFCGEVGSAVETLNLVRRLRPDAVVVGLAFRDCDGFGLLNALHVSHPDLQVLVYSTYEEKKYAGSCLCAGASGYVMKTAPMQMIVEALKTILRGEVYLSEEAAVHVLRAGMNPSTRRLEMARRMRAEGEHEARTFAS
jgi:DNA-binding NarL/FixJ family response regulator